MKYLMLHDIRDIDEKYFPKRYSQPYFYTQIGFKDILKKFVPKSFDNQNPKGFIYTFDDGLLDHYKVAEILFEMNIRAIFFVPSSPVINRDIVLSHKIQFIIATKEEPIIVKELKKIIQKNYEIDSKELNQYKKSNWTTNIWSEDMIFITRILREFKSNKERKILCDELFSKFVSKDEKDFANNFYLNSKQVKEISDMNHLIGGHGHKSDNLIFCTENEIKDEINLSNQFINQFKPEKKYYAYANGGFNDLSVNLLNKLKYDMAFTTSLENIGNSKIEKLFIKRIDPSK